MFLIISILLFGVIITPSTGSKLPVLYDIKHAESLFENFIKTYNKTYSSDTEKKTTETLKSNNKLNSAGTATYGINHFSDLAHKELFPKHPADNPLFKKCSVVRDSDVTTRDAPSSLDWSKCGLVGKVKNEGECKAHWAFAVVGNIVGQYAKAKGEILELSEQELIDCISDCYGCGHCSSKIAFSSLIGIGGMLLESDYPYANKQQSTCQYKSVLSKLNVTACVQYNLCDEDNLKEILAKKGPLYVAINGESLKKYTGGIISDCPAKDMNHAVLLVGYGTENDTDYWLIKNSWGATWGAHGYAKIRRGTNTCGIMNPEIASAVIEA